MDNQWIKNIYNSIKDFSDLERQKVLWQGLDENYASSFDEDVNLLFDSFCFEEFIFEWNKEKPNNSLTNEFYSLKDMLNSYEKKRSDKEILEDPAWLNIVNKAKNIIEIWDIKN